jgi:hypothetical protein
VSQAGINRTGWQKAPPRHAVWWLTRRPLSSSVGTLRTELPVRSAELKQCTGGLVVRWVTTGEYPLLYVFGIFVVGDDKMSGEVGGDRDLFLLERTGFT